MDIGYRGRTGIYELLSIDDQIRDLLLQNKDSSSIKSAAIRNGMQTLRDAGLAKALRGETTIEEVLRVTQEET
jgi:general secretion pathway protein E